MKMTNFLRLTGPGYNSLQDDRSRVMLHCEETDEHRCFTFLVLTERRKALGFSPALLLLPLADGNEAEGGLHGAPRVAVILSVPLILDAMLLFSVNTKVLVLLKSLWLRSISSPFLILLR